MSYAHHNKGLSRKVFDNGNGSNRHPPTFLSGIVESEMDLASKQLDNVRKMHEHLKRSLDETQSAINTEIMQLEERMPRYSPYKYPERDKLLTRLHTLEQERRKLSVERQKEEHRLQWQLLALKNKQAQLKPREHGEPLN